MPWTETWWCDQCGKSGTFGDEWSTNVYGVFARAKRAHREASPKCDAVPGFGQRIESQPPASGEGK